MTLTLDSLSRSYGGFHAVQSVSLSLSTNAIVGMIGPNGAGKTTLFSLINGLQSPSSGSVSLDGLDLTTLPAFKRARAGLAWTFQVPRPFSHLTVLENLLVAARNQPGDSILRAFFQPRATRRFEVEIERRAKQILEFLRLSHVSEEFSKNLSGGQKKLVELGRALMLEPKFILLDEPFAGVNPVLIDEISERIIELNQLGIGFLIIEHNIGALSRLCKRMVVLDHGRAIGDGSPAQVLADETVRMAYLGESV
ncbi:ABC transporter ATP-binding protein [Bosea massiliensis]|uniref:ABC transporter ATP-binding protein n=1 Tax=Bosea massiliensis TaxID=151419 RepID=A0ABW0PAU0_9HYPH